MNEKVSSFKVSTLYSNEEIFASLGVGNTGGVRVKRDDASGTVQRVVIFTSIPTSRQIFENPYYDRLEEDMLIYTGAGRVGEQTVSGSNARIVEQQETGFPIYAFIQVAGRRDKSVGVKRWSFLGLGEYLRGYQECQTDVHNKARTVWVFEFRVHTTPAVVTVAHDKKIMNELLSASLKSNDMDREVVDQVVEVDSANNEMDLVALENTRKRFLAYDPRQFEHVISDILLKSGFEKVDVTRYSQDGGIDINAHLGNKIWPLRHLLTQIQAKRWLHTVGRKEVAELRGSLQPHASGCLVTTSRFSRAALAESVELGKVPITVIDGYALARIVRSVGLG